MKSCLSSILNEDELSKGCRVCWQHQEPNSSQKIHFPSSLPKRETPTSTIMGTRSGVWYPVALPWDQRFCVLFSHIYKERCTWIALKKIKKTQLLSVHTQQTATDESEASPGFSVGAARCSLSIPCTTTAKDQLHQLQSQLMQPSLECVSQITARN